MRESDTFTSEHRSFQWDLVLQFEEGSLPPSVWSEGTLRTIAGWYAQNVERTQAQPRYEKAYALNRRRLANRLGESTVSAATLEALDAIRDAIIDDAYAKRSA